MDHFKLQMVNERKNEQKTNKMILKTFLAIKHQFIKQIKYIETLKAVKLNSDRQRQRRLLTLIINSNIFRVLWFNFHTKTQQREAERRARRASLKIYMKMKRFIKRGGLHFDFPLDNGKQK